MRTTILMLIMNKERILATLQTDGRTDRQMNKQTDGRAYTFLESFPHDDFIVIYNTACLLEETPIFSQKIYLYCKL